MKEKTEKTARIFLIDEHPAMRHRLQRLLLQASHTVCGEAGSRGEALERIGASVADIVLLDLSLGNESGLELIPRLRKLGLCVLVYYMSEDPDTIERAYAVGADGYVSKRELADVLLVAVSALLEGRRYISPRVAQILANRALTPLEDNPGTALSEREQQILAMLGQGESNADIAAAFEISIRTVETYFARVIAKLNLEGMKELRRCAIRHKL
jgi:DNA-binding NarL/FixJ family response regulator